MRSPARLRLSPHRHRRDVPGGRVEGAPRSRRSLGRSRDVARLARTRRSMSATAASAIDGHDVARRDPHSRDRHGRGGRCASAEGARGAHRTAACARAQAAGCHGRARHRHGRLPRADVKIFLDASPEERARRRASDPRTPPAAAAPRIQEVATALAERDRSDRTRAASPLKQADDAVVIDTTALSIEEAVERVMEEIVQTTAIGRSPISAVCAATSIERSQSAIPLDLDDSRLRLSPDPW